MPIDAQSDIQTRLLSDTAPICADATQKPRETSMTFYDSIHVVMYKFPGPIDKSNQHAHNMNMNKST